MQKRNMRQEMIMADELMGKLREQGIERIEEVKKAYLEGDRRISVITTGSKGDSKGAEVGGPERSISRAVMRCPGKLALLVRNAPFTSSVSPHMATNESPRLSLLIKPRSAFFTSTAARQIVESGEVATPDPAGADGFDWREDGEFAGVGAPRIQPSHEPLAPLRLIFEAD